MRYREEKLEKKSVMYRAMRMKIVPKVERKERQVY